MKIIRDGKEIELTRDEIYQAYVNHEKTCHIEDILSKYEVPEDKINEAEERFEHALSRNDSYFESYWLTIEYICEEMGLKELETEAE